MAIPYFCFRLPECRARKRHENVTRSTNSDVVVVINDISMFGNDDGNDDDDDDGNDAPTACVVPSKCDVFIGEKKSLREGSFVVCQGKEKKVDLKKKFIFQKNFETSGC